MKRTLATMVCLLLSCLIAPGVSSALSNNIEISLDRGSGGYTSPPLKGDVETLDMNLFYTRLLEGLESDGTPYGARVFLQHPSYISAAFMRGESESAFGSMSSETTSDTISLSGMYFTPARPYSTGVGLAYADLDSESKVSSGGSSGSSSSDRTDITLMLSQYLAHGVMVSVAHWTFELESNFPFSFSNIVSRDGALTTLRLSALIDRLWLSGFYQDGEVDWPAAYDNEDTDVSTYGLEIGAFLDQQTGVLLSYSTMEYSDDYSSSDDTYIILSLDYYLDETTHITGRVGLHEMESGSSYEREETIIGAGGGVFF